jgi:hypothetical protein
MTHSGICRRLNQRALLVASLMLFAASASSVWAGVPDWSGLWEVDGLAVGSSGVVETPVPAILSEFGQTPPYTQEGATKFQAFLKDTLPQFTAVPHKLCTVGFPWVMLESPLVFEVLNTPQETAMVFSNREARHIHTDGRPQPPADELFPTHWGSSVGRWEGDSLVVETISSDARAIFIDNAVDFVQVLALPSDQTRYVERLRRVAKDALEDQMTIYDPKQFTSP